MEKNTEKTMDQLRKIAAKLNLDIDSTNYKESVQAMEPIDENATKTTMANVFELSKELINEMSIQTTEYDIREMDVETLQEALNRKIAEAKEAEETKAKMIDERNAFRLKGSSLVWRPVFLFCDGYLKGMESSPKRDYSSLYVETILRAIIVALTANESTNNMAARLSSSLTEAKVLATSDENGMSIICSILCDINTISRSILDTEKSTALNGYEVLSDMTDVIDSWISITY